MPGFYVSNEGGGGVGSGLASAISQIANAYNPETIARAGNLAQSTENLKYSNWQKSLEVPATLNAMKQAIAGAQTLGDEVYNQPGPSIPSAVAKATVNPSMAPGGDPYYVPPTPGHPEDQRGGVDYSHAGIFGSLAAQQVALGHGADEVTKLFNYGHQVVNGPGTDPTSRTAVENAAQIADRAPFDTIPGRVHVIPDLVGPYVPSGPPAQAPAPAPPAVVGGATPPSVAAVPGAGGGGGAAQTTPAATPPAAPTTSTAPVPSAGAVQIGPGMWQGGSVFQQAAQEAGGKTANDEFAADRQNAADASRNMQGVENLMNLYGSVIHDNSPGDMIANNVMDAVSNYLKMAIPGKQVARFELQKQAAQLIGNLRSSMGINRVTQYEFQKFQDMLTNGNMPKEMFFDMMNAMRARLVQQQQIGPLTNSFTTDSSPENAERIRQMKQAIYAQDPFEEMRRNYPSVFPQAEVDAAMARGTPGLGSSGGTSPVQEGQTVYNREGKAFVIKNGEAVPVGGP